MPEPPGKKVIGMLLDERGKLIRDGFVSGKPPPSERGERLTGKMRYATTANDHAEGHIARFLRRPENQHLRRLNVILSKTPCPPDDPNRPGLSCEEILRDILPEGVRVDVYVRDSHGLRYHDTYLGTGNAVEKNQ